MIKIYTSYNNIDKGQVIENPEAFFNGYITSEDFAEKDFEVMKIIDNAELLDKQLGTIKTPRGITSIDNLSTGCKTVLTYIYILKHSETNKTFLELSYCGANAIDHLFDLVGHEDKIKFILRHKDRIYECKERDYLINDKKRITNLAWI